MERKEPISDRIAPKAYESQFTSNASRFIQEMNELSADSLELEETLNALRLSNVTRLGYLRKEQEKEILKAAMHANEEVMKQKYKLQKQALEEEFEARLAEVKNQNKKANAEELDKIEENIKKEFELRRKYLIEQSEWEKKNKEKELKQEAAKAKRDAIKKGKDYQKEQINTFFGKEKTLGERIEAFKNLATGGGKTNEYNSISQSKLAGFANVASALTNALADFAKQLETQMDEIAGKKGIIDTRLQGSSNAKRMGSYWDQMTANITGMAGVSPLIKQSAIAERVSNMVGQGIAFNVEQRAVLQELSGKIATTFNAANDTLLRLVRIQQQDTTAGRLGMESALTAFLNNMYETTEYMSNLAASVKGSLEEAMSLMTGENALSFEYQIQKWLGSLYSVGMSNSSVQGLAGVLGQIASGKIEGVTSGGQGNLVIMAATNAGLNISDILSEGLDQSTTNILLNSMVDYLAKIYNEAGNSKVIQQQIANVYGLSASDLKAAVNLSKSRSTVARDGLDYKSAMDRLYSMADSMYGRTSIGEMMTNIWDNVKYSLSAGMVNNPITYALYKASGLLKDTTGGIDFGLPLIMGNGLPMTFNVADLMRVGALAGGAISSMAQMIGGMGGGGITGRGILRAAGIQRNAVNIETRGTGLGLATMSGATTSESGSMVGNASSDDVTNKTMTDKTDSAKQETASAVDESDEIKLKDVDNHILNIIDILKNIADGDSTLKVSVEGAVQIADFFGSGL